MKSNSKTDLLYYNLKVKSNPSKSHFLWGMEKSAGFRAGRPEGLKFGYTKMIVSFDVARLNIKKEGEMSETKRCEHCGKQVSRKYTVCPICGGDLRDDAPALPAACPRCKAPLEILASDG